MLLYARFDIKNNIEIITIKGYKDISFLLGTNFINFISLNIEDVLSNEIISNLSESNYKEVINKLTIATSEIVIPEIITMNVLIDLSSENIDIQQIRNDLTKILNVYNQFKQLVEFCYFNDSLESMMPLKKYIYYLHESSIEEVKLPQRAISSFGLNPQKKSSTLLKDDDVLVMLQKNSPFLHFAYECSNINDYMTAVFFELIENNYVILKCKNCGKYFIPYNRSDTLYCDRISPQDISKSCKKYGADLAWHEKIKDESDWHCLYRRVYQSLQMKAKRNKGHKPSELDFERFKKESKKWKKEIKEHTKTDKEFLRWLQMYRKK